MKNEDMLLALNLIDNKYIEEAAPKKRRVGVRISIIAAVLFLLSVALFLFFPYDARPPSVKEYSGSDYYETIQKINEYTYQKPEFANNFDRYLSSYILSQNEVPPDSSESMGDVSAEFADPTEFASNLSANIVNDGDIYAANDSHIFMPQTVFSINGENSKIIQHYNFNGRKFFMSQDGNTLLSVYSGSEIDFDTGKKQRFTNIIAYDVRDPKNIKDKSYVTLSGSLINCIYNNGKLIVVASYSPSVKDLDYSDPLTFVPHISRNYGEFSAIPAGAITAPEKITSLRYTEFLMLDANDLSVIDFRAHISESSNVYISSDSIYTTRTVASEKSAGENIIITPQTVLTRIAYSDSGFTPIAAMLIDGQVVSHNFSNEKDGTLYAVTKTAVIERHNKLPIYSCCECMHRETLVSRNAAIYVIDTASMQIKEQRSDICEKDLRIESVSYSGNNAYLTFSGSSYGTGECIAIDLSSLQASESKPFDTQNSGMIAIGDSLFLTLNDIRATKQSPRYTTVSIFSCAGNVMENIASYDIKGASSSATYNTNKRVFIDMERGLIGFNIMREQYEGEKPDRYDADGMPEFNESRYVLLKYDDGKLKLIADVPISDNDWDVRAIYRDGYLYAFSERGIIALSIDAE